MTTSLTITRPSTISREKLNLLPTKHEPCLYRGHYNGHEVLFLRQVNNFALSSASNDTDMAIIQAIDEEMEIAIKDLVRMTRYNCVNITQTKHLIKLSNETYIAMIM